MVRRRDDPELPGDEWSGDLDDPDGDANPEGDRCSTCERVPAGGVCEGPPPYPRPCSRGLSGSREVPTDSPHVQPPAQYLWWLSFVDPARCQPDGRGEPGGPGFLGVAIVAANSYVEAVRTAHRLGCNPGGQVEGHGPLPLDGIGPEWRNRLLTYAEADNVPDPYIGRP